MIGLYIFSICSCWMFIITFYLIVSLMKFYLSKVRLMKEVLKLKAMVRSPLLGLNNNTFVYYFLKSIVSGRWWCSRCLE